MSGSPRLNFGLKISSRCNLNCSYCYVYNKGDTTWRGRPSMMSDEVFNATSTRIRDYCRLSGQGSVQIVFHGGEPTLVGRAKIGAWCAQMTSALSGIAQPFFAIQT